MLQHPKFPFLRIAICIVSGILIEFQFTLGLLTWISISGMSIATILLYQKMGRALKWKYKFMSGLCLYLLLISAGAISKIHDVKKNFPSINIKKYGWITLHITSEATQTQNGIRYEGAIYAIENKQKEFVGYCFLYLKDKKLNAFQQNDILICSNKSNKILPKKDPFVFDFFVFAQRKKINYTLHLDSHQLLKIGEVHSMLDLITSGLRNYFLQTLRKNIPNPIICGLAEAMLTGYREDLDKELLTAYTNTGVVHIIAISGLHLGLIFWLANFLLQKIIPHKWLPAISITTILPLLWTFSIMTGSSASILRSVVMFSLSITANALAKRNNNMNALLASGVMLLLYDPTYVFDIGFQLSYAAVASILLFEKKIRNIFNFKNKAALYGWSMVSITLAAQIITTPFVIYHFHRFPALFLFSNLIAVPLSSIILLLEIGLCFADLIGFGAAQIGQLISFLTTYMNNYVEIMHNIPFNLISEIYLSGFSIFLYSSIALILINFIIKYFNINLFNNLILLFISSALILSEQFIRPIKRDWTVLQLSGNTCIVHRHGRSIRIFYKKNSKEDPAVIRKKLQNAINYLQPEQIFWQSLPEFPFILQLNCQKHLQAAPVILLSGISELRLSNLAGVERAGTLVIADGTHKLWKIKVWEKEAHELNLRFLSTSFTGSVTIDCH